MKELEKIVAANITELRKSKKLTQAELAEKINYSDKSVSKWERGESIPDIKVLSDLAELFGVSLDFFVHENAFAEKEKYQTDKTALGYRIAINLLAVVVVWLVAILAFVYVQLTDGKNMWIYFVWAVPVSLIFLHYQNKKCFGGRHIVIIDSFLNWSILTSAFLYILIWKNVNIWMIYLIGIPMQVSIILLFLARKYKN
ncbi:MAG: helix-turn-helix transcriptional regulator [Eubacteriales bacterium]|nr:helix-turn-helix transcriptional regulator [Eubacteriales bacterium]